METWECQSCRASARIDQSRRPVVYHATYPAATGPYSDRPPSSHSCPIKQGLLPDQLAQHPNARRVN
jgi:hypothetical protein